MIEKAPSNISPIDLLDWLQSDSQRPLLIDVREESELAIASFTEEVLHCPLSLASSWITTLPEQLSKQQSVVVICHSGIRSWNFASWLIEKGCISEVWNLEGGIDAWSAQVDPSVPRY